MAALSLAFTEGQARALGMASMARSHHAHITFVLQSWGMGWQAQLCCRVPLSRPKFLSSPCPPHQCATIALMWLMSRVYLHLWWEKCWFVWTLCGTPWAGSAGMLWHQPHPTHCQPLFTSSKPLQHSQGSFPFQYTEVITLLAQDGFPRTVAAGICVQLQSSEDPLEMDSGRVFQLRSFSCSRAAWNMYNHYVLLFILTLYKMKLCVICLILNGLNRFLFNSFNLLTRYKIGLSQKLFLSVKGWGGWLLAWLYCDYDS